MKFLSLIVKNIGRNLVRTILTALGTMMLVFVVTLVWSILDFLNLATTAKNTGVKLIITDKWQIPSQMPFTYASSLSEGAVRKPDDIKPLDSMTWQFYVGFVSKEKSERSFETVVFAFALEPKKLATMMDELDNLQPQQAAELAETIKKLEANDQGIILGPARMKSLNKKIGDTFTIYSTNYPDINLEVTVVGTFPPGRYNQNSAINRDYLNRAMDVYKRQNGKEHAMARRTLNLVWLKVNDAAEAAKLQEQIDSSPDFTSPEVKCETASAGVSTFLDAYRDLIWGMRWLLAPAILVTLALVISNAISISVRERRTELAVLKVLGFRPNQIMVLVLGEALLIGVLSGTFSSWLTYGLVNIVIGGVPFPIAFFSAFMISIHALWWGPVLGGVTALLGSFVPAWTARNVLVSEVFSRVT
jgi:putative ABC transport system permease protein